MTWREITKLLYLSDLEINHLVVREWLNGFWFVASVCALIVFGKYLAQAPKHRNWYRRPGNTAAIALFIYFVGETLMRGWIWLLLVAQNTGHIKVFSILSEDYFIGIIAAILSMTGLMMCVKVFGGKRAWIYSAIFILLFCAGETWLF